MTTPTTEPRELTAGRELDALVAEKVMGLRVFPSWNSRSGHEAKAAEVVYPFAVVDRVSANDDAEGIRVYGTDYCDGIFWFPSTYIGHAWHVVAEVQRRNPGWRFSLLGGDEQWGYTRRRKAGAIISGGTDREDTYTVDKTQRSVFGWMARFFGSQDATIATPMSWGESHADTAPLAICLAALKAVEP